MGVLNEPVNVKLVNIALEEIDGNGFEHFAQDFAAGILGREFVPLGGYHDHGKDGIFQVGNTKIFIQISIQEDYRAKIRQTVKRLEATGNDVSTLYYYSSMSIPLIDNEEDHLSDALGVNVKIRDRKYILSHINDSMATKAAYYNHLEKWIAFLQTFTNRPMVASSKNTKDPTVFVFLQNQLTDDRDSRSLIHSVTDSLILWSLSETDPEKEIYMTENDISNKIHEQFPWIQSLIDKHIGRRLEVLTLLSHYCPDKLSLKIL